MNPYSVLKKPLLSEKSNKLREEVGQYTFLVQLEANKTQVKAAVEKLFEVQVAKVRTMIMRGKERRRGQFSSQTSKRKKAVVTLRAGQKLAIFEDQ